MKKQKFVVYTLLILLLLGSTGAHASEDKVISTNYSVRAILPENQRDSQLSSFDLKVTPGQRQVLQVAISNESEEEIEVALEANIAFSNENGLIEFDFTEGRDPSLQIDFSKIVYPVEQIVKVPALGEAIADFVVEMPPESFDGVAFGGLLFTKLGQEGTEGELSMGIRNVYRYAVGVRLRESEEAVEPAFELTDVALEQTKKSQTALLLHLRNPQPLIARGIKLLVDVYPHDNDQVVKQFVKENVGMAPNSSMAYRIRLGGGNALDAGLYRVVVTLEYEGGLHQFESQLVVS